MEEKYYFSLIKKKHSAKLNANEHLKIFFIVEFSSEKRNK
jgi:hypothetical protein